METRGILGWLSEMRAKTYLAFGQVSQLRNLTALGIFPRSQAKLFEYWYKEHTEKPSFKFTGISLEYGPYIISTCLIKIKKQRKNYQYLPRFSNNLKIEENVHRSIHRGSPKIHFVQLRLTGLTFSIKSHFKSQAQDALQK